MKRSILICTTLAIAITLTVPHLNEACSSDDWIPIKIKSHTVEHLPGSKISIGSTIHFANGKQMKSELIGMSYIGQLSSTGNAPYLIFSARSNPWEGEIAIFMLSPSKGNIDVTERNQRFYYPGKLYELSAEHSLIHESRMFFGDCLIGYGSVAVWFIKYRSGPGSSVYIAEVRDGRLHTGFLKPPLPALKNTLSLVQDDQCIEVPGLDMTEEP